MFLQVIQGQVVGAEPMREALDRWYDELAPGAAGWLGTTAGVTADGTFVGIVRFESTDAARRNSDRPAQHEWWVETAKLFAGDVSFDDCDEVITYLQGGSDDAGFVQVIQGHAGDVDELRAATRRAAEPLKQFRPEIIGGIVGLRDDARMTEAVYFTTEAAAHEGERKPVPPQLRELLDDEAARPRDPVYFDLTDPWLYSPRRPTAG